MDQNATFPWVFRISCILCSFKCLRVEHYWIGSPIYWVYGLGAWPFNGTNGNCLMISMIGIFLMTFFKGSEPGEAKCLCHSWKITTIKLKNFKYQQIVSFTIVIIYTSRPPSTLHWVEKELIQNGKLLLGRVRAPPPMSALRSETYKMFKSNRDRGFINYFFGRWGCIQLGIASLKPTMTVNFVFRDEDV